jgi:hypothetical protein
MPITVIFSDEEVDTFLNMRDKLADEGDRVYFGSTNDADAFRELVRAIEDARWAKIMAAPPEADDE